MTEGSEAPSACDAPELSVVMPCLNEAETLAKCIEKAQRAFETLPIRGEVIVADNGSTDGSQAIGKSLGARVVPIEAKGYGHALRGGIEAARGRYVIMGDSDDSYDFSEIAPLVSQLRDGVDLVMGNRFKGGIRPAAMPWKHRWIGNPVLTAVGRLFFRSPVGDFHCGLRGFSKAAYDRMDLRTIGMEFASEMVIKSTLKGMKIAEVPIVLHKDGRSRPPHLRSWRDGWRHLRFMLLFSPLWLFLIPGAAMFFLGMAAEVLLAGSPVRVAGIELDIHTMLIGSFMAVLGFQIVIFGIFTKSFAVNQGIHPPSLPLERLVRILRLEFGVAAGLVLLLGGGLYLLFALEHWKEASFGALNPRITMRQVIPAVTLLSLGVQTIFASFFLGVLGLGRTSR